MVLVPGYVDLSRIYRRMRRELEEDGHVVHAPEWESRTGADGLDALASQLKGEVDRAVPEGERFGIVAFSMGSIVSRIYLQEMGGHARCTRFVSLSGPHAGTHLGYLGHTRGGREMRPGSAILKRLEQTVSALAPLAPVSIYTPFDLTILPPSSSRVEWAENVTVPVMMHPLVPSDGRVVGRIRRIFQRAAAPLPGVSRSFCTVQ